LEHTAGVHIYVDESKSKGYLLIAVVVAPGLLKSIRRRMLGLCMPGQRSIHFVNERNSRRRLILSEIVRMELHAHAYIAIGFSQAGGRDACLKLLLDSVRALAGSTIVFEKDESSEKADRALMHSGLLERGLAKSIEYKFAARSEDPILWIADAIAWSYSRGGEFKKSIKPLISLEMRMQSP
jgi:hypothetical protein